MQEYRLQIFWQIAWISVSSNPALIDPVLQIGT